jgi:hypothetical protein
MMRMRWLFVAAGVVALLLTVSACGSAEPPPAVSIAEACSADYDGQPATVNGFFQLDFMVFCTDSCLLDFAETPEGESPLAPDIKVGSGRNQMRALPEDFQDADFQITTDDGTVLGLGDPVQISGEMSIAENVCLMYVNRINAAPGGDEAVGD